MLIKHSDNANVRVLFNTGNLFEKKIQKNFPSST
nr:MAG TPA: hypothetical protein [Caudoviricetes sp.]